MRLAILPYSIVIYNFGWLCYLSAKWESVLIVHYQNICLNIRYNPVSF